MWLPSSGTRTPSDTAMFLSGAHSGNAHANWLPPFAIVRALSGKLALLGSNVPIEA
jgi:hypothetical protein